MRRTFLKPIVGIASMSVMFMWLMPSGTFDLTELGFYICIGLAISLEFSIRATLKKYQKDYLDKVK
ncbi:hypothetical protein ADIS_4254 [Lunatimonas lonarensis]|uniref:Uncharacterized protein n=1 Tax=Lunatimonas lonarensis TaxID=1232681 RepID=R7ZLW9_9BACT|nr:hypothetical protein ADIS_4254 [Lunatimonas lonarensis]